MPTDTLGVVLHAVLKPHRIAIQPIMCPPQGHNPPATPRGGAGGRARPIELHAVMETDRASVPLRLDWRNNSIALLISCSFTPLFFSLCCSNV